MRMNKDYEKDVFTTLDAYISGFLVMRGFIPKLVQQRSKVVFSFQSSDKLFEAISDYNSGANVQAVSFALAVKTLKSRIFSLRRNKENNCEPEETKA